MSKNEMSLVDRFKKLEEELVAVLKIEEPSFEEDTKKQVVKSQLKSYIKKVEKARELFDEYESVAKQIETLAKKDKEAVSAEIVALREEENKKEKEVYVDEILAEKGIVRQVKKKKKSVASREL